MKPVADMTEAELVATIRACELRLNGPQRGITEALRQSLLSRMENCRAELMVRGRGGSHFEARTVNARSASYSLRQSPDNALMYNAFFGSLEIGHVAGPYQSGKSDFYEWRLKGDVPSFEHQFGRSPVSGRARTQTAAFNALVNADKMRRGTLPPSGRKVHASRPKPVDDPTYIVQGLYNGGTIAEEFGFDDEDTARTEAWKLSKSPYFEGDYVRVITRDGELVWSSKKGVDEVRAPKVRAADKQATKPGKHGTLRLWKVTYKDSDNPAFGEDSFRKWAYNKEHIQDQFGEGEEESWEIVKIEPVFDTGPTRLSRESTQHA